MKQSIAYGIAGLMAMSSGVAMAQDRYSDDSHVYIGGAYGGFKARGGDFDDDQDFYEFSFGGFFNPYLGLEASATFFGEYGGDLVEADAEGYGVALIGRLPLTDSWGIYAKAGQFFWDVDVDSDLGSASTDGDDPFFGVGTDIRLATNLSMIIEYDRYKIDTAVEDWPGVDDTDLDTVKVGLRLRF
ncbi:porin family protein [Marinimicrobium sp. ARAG 43.8]|uniref:porin family protein n=1 Tax=Marinimicrobium sp. ARAG 43.8 TaxID=3418719 RepID=UPI003CEDD6CF